MISTAITFPQAAHTCMIFNSVIWWVTKCVNETCLTAASLAGWIFVFAPKQTKKKAHCWLELVSCFVQSSDKKELVHVWIMRLEDYHVGVMQLSWNNERFWCVPQFQKKDKTNISHGLWWNMFICQMQQKRTKLRCDLGWIFTLMLTSLCDRQYISTYRLLCSSQIQHTRCHGA